MSQTLVCDMCLEPPFDFVIRIAGSSLQSGHSHNEVVG
jgi:hypothetical protein